VDNMGHSSDEAEQLYKNIWSYIYLATFKVSIE